ncbi:dTMP kinase [Patescibacteria group bacterium]|nr:dTMP kinase [Patescibacteria group bacterium]MBU1938337.1 dTMP kinase [Patescibacteria group bacterium]
MFIAFEGLDGSGSSTQSRLLADRLEKNGMPTLLTKEPTSDTPIGKMIREILQHKWSASPEGLQLLFSADRAEHLKNEIEPALEGGQAVITDRYLFSTLAYGGMNVDMEWLKGLNKNFRLPDITFLFKLDPEECIERIAGRGSHFELFERTDKLAKIWENYERIAEEFPNIQVIDASKSIEEISEEIWNLVRDALY